jgi:hypothetical protein
MARETGETEEGPKRPIFEETNQGMLNICKCLLEKSWLLFLSKKEKDARANRSRIARESLRSASLMFFKPKP